jgi:hypothetical protein
MAFRIAMNDVEDVKAHLDYREKNGYCVMLLPIYDIDGALITEEVFIIIINRYLSFRHMCTYGVFVSIKFVQRRTL